MLRASFRLDFFVHQKFNSIFQLKYPSDFYISFDSTSVAKLESINRNIVHNFFSIISFLLDQFQGLHKLNHLVSNTNRKNGKAQVTRISSRFQQNAYLNTHIVVSSNSVPSYHIPA